MENSIKGINSSDLPFTLSDQFNQIQERFSEPAKSDVEIKEKSDSEVEKENIVNTKSDTQVDDVFKEYHDTALIAEALKQKGYLRVDEVAKDLSLDQLISTLEDSRRKESEEIYNALLNEANEYKNFFDLKLNGVNDDVIDEIASKTIFSKLKLEINPEDEGNEKIESLVERNKEKIVREEFKYKDIPDNTINLLIESFKEKGVLTEKALEARNFFSKEEERLTNQEKQRAIDIKKQEAEYVRRIADETNRLISSKKISGYTLTDDDSVKLKNFIMTPSVTVNVQDEKGNLIPIKITEYEKRQEEFSRNLEAQLSFAMWLMKGNSFEPMKNQGKEEQHNALYAAIKNRSNKKDTVPDPLLEDLLNAR